MELNHLKLQSRRGNFSWRCWESNPDWNGSVWDLLWRGTTTSRATITVSLHVSFWGFWIEGIIRGTHHHTTLLVGWKCVDWGLYSRNGNVFFVWGARLLVVRRSGLGLCGYMAGLKFFARLRRKSEAGWGAAWIAWQLMVILGDRLHCCCCIEPPRDVSGLLFLAFGDFFFCFSF